MASKKTKQALPTFSQKTVFEVRSKCSDCGSLLRAYNKITKETKCNQCGKKQPNPRQDLNNLEFDDNLPDLSALENKQTDTCLLCGGSNLTFDSSMNIVCDDCGTKQPLGKAKLELTNDQLFYRKNDFLLFF